MGYSKCPYSSSSTCKDLPDGKTRCECWRGYKEQNGKCQGKHQGALPATVWREKSMGREISDARGREETSVQLANRNCSESEKFLLAFSTPREKSVRFGRLTNQWKENKRVKNSIEGYVKRFYINVSPTPSVTDFERWKRACTNSVLLCLFKILMSVRRSQVDVEREPAGTTEAGLVVVVQEDIDIMGRHVPVTWCT